MYRKSDNKLFLKYFKRCGLMRKYFCLLLLFAIYLPSISQARTDDNSTSITITNIVEKERTQLSTQWDEIFSKQNALFEEWNSLPDDEKTINYQSFKEEQDRLAADRDAITRQLGNIELKGIVTLIENFHGNRPTLLDQIEQQTPLTVKEKLTRKIGYIYTTIISFLAGIVAVAQEKADKLANEFILKAQQEAETMMMDGEKSHVDNNTKRVQLEQWHNCLSSANQKLTLMKESHISAQRKICKTLSIIKKQYPQGEKHFRYIENKVKELSVCYKNAKDQFEVLYS